MALGLVVGLAAMGVLPGRFNRGAEALQSGSDAAPRQAERASNPSASAGPATDRAVLRELSAAALDAQTAEVEKRLRQLEQDHSREFMQSGQEDWPAAVNGIERELSRLEQPMENFLLNPSGEKR